MKNTGNHKERRTVTSCDTEKYGMIDAGNIVGWLHRKSSGIKNVIMEYRKKKFFTTGHVARFTDNK